MMKAKFLLLCLLVFMPCTSSCGEVVIFAEGGGG